MASAPLASPRPEDELALEVQNRRVGGWESISVTLRCEGFPNAFQVGLSTVDPLNRGLLAAAPGDPCKVYLGNDLVITGHVDTYTTSAASASHGITLSGRGKCADLIDCDEDLPGFSTAGTPLQIASKLAARYGVETIIAPGVVQGAFIPQYLLDLGVPVAETVQRLASATGVLAYEDRNGRLRLGNAGDSRAKGGVSYGVNVEAFNVSNSMLDRYSEIVCAYTPLEFTGDLAGTQFFHTERDPNVRRFRRLYIFEELGSPDPYGFTIRRAKWEVARRAGRSVEVRVTVDSWRDGAGELWQPNSIVPTELPGLNPLLGNDLCLSEVTFRRDSSGTHADLLLYPKQAFTPPPIILVPVNTADFRESDGGLSPNP